MDSSTRTRPVRKPIATKFQYPLRVKWILQHRLVAPAAGDIITFQYPLRVKWILQPPDSSRYTASSSLFQYPLRVKWILQPRDPSVPPECVNPFQYPLRVKWILQLSCQRRVMRAGTISVPSTGQVDSSTEHRCAHGLEQTEFQYPLRVKWILQLTVRSLPP